MYSRSFEMMVAVNRMRVMEIMASTTNAIAEGEVMQLLHLNSPDIGETEYLEMIERKTARLFQSATQLAGVLAGADATTEKALTAFGLNLGIAFQISDDLLDYVNCDRVGEKAGSFTVDPRWQTAWDFASRQYWPNGCAKTVVGRTVARQWSPLSRFRCR